MWLWQPELCCITRLVVTATVAASSLSVWWEQLWSLACSQAGFLLREYSVFKVSCNTVDLRGMCVVNLSSSLSRAKPKRVCQKHPSEHQCKGRSDRCRVLGAAWLQRQLQGYIWQSALQWMCGERERECCIPEGMGWVLEEKR